MQSVSACRVIMREGSGVILWKESANHGCNGIAIRSSDSDAAGVGISNQSGRLAMMAELTRHSWRSCPNSSRRVRCHIGRLAGYRSRRSRCHQIRCRRSR